MICLALTVVILLIVQPWNFLLLDAFIIGQIVTVGIIIFIKLFDVCCSCCCGLSEGKLQLSIVIVLTCLYLNATTCGFLHPDISFRTHSVRVPVEEVQAANDQIVPLTASGSVIVAQSQRNAAKQAETERKKMATKEDENQKLYEVESANDVDDGNDSSAEPSEETEKEMINI